MFPPEVAQMLAQCSAPVVLVVDHAKSPKNSATSSAEALPALSPYKRTMKAKRATRRGRQPQGAGEAPTPPCSPSLMVTKKRVLQLRTELLVPACRWTAETTMHCLPSKHHHHHDPITTNQAPRKPGQFRSMAEPSSGRCDSLKSLLSHSSPSSSSMTSPRMPRRKASFRIPKDQSSPLCTSGEDDSSSSGPPRQPKRRYRLDTADLLQETVTQMQGMTGVGQAAASLDSLPTPIRSNQSWATVRGERMSSNNPYAALTFEEGDSENESTDIPSREISPPPIQLAPASFILLPRTTPTPATTPLREARRSSGSEIPALSGVSFMTKSDEHGIDDVDPDL